MVSDSLVPFYPAFTLDLEAAIKSVQKIKKLKAEKIICYHGGTMEKGIETKLDSLLTRNLQKIEIK